MRMPRVVAGIVVLALALVACTRLRRCNEDEPTPLVVEIAVASGFEAQATDDGTVVLRFNHSRIGGFTWKFFGQGFRWADARVRTGAPQGAVLPLTIEVPDLGVVIAGTIAPVGERELVLDFEANVRNDLVDIEGGGIELELVGSPRIFGREPAPPSVRADGRGLAWDTGHGTIEIVADEELPHVYIERSPFVVRMWLLGHDVAAGTHRTTIRVKLPEPGVALPSIASRYAPVDSARWAPDALPWDRLPDGLDLSFLNDGDRPAGTKGPVRAEGERLVLADGTTARFWGTNVVAYSLFAAPDAAIEVQADRLARLGFNLVRLHHHDSHWVQPNVFDGGDTAELRDASLDRIDRWVDALQRRGIYVWLDLHVGRVLTAGDGIPGFEELPGGDLRGFNFVSPEIEGAMDRFARQFLDRTNRYSGRRYADDPGVLAVLVTNENDLTQHFGNMMLAIEPRPHHVARMQAAVDAFVERSGLEVPSPIEPWRAGPSKIAMAELEARFGLRAIESLRSFGVSSLVATSSLWGDEPLYAVPSLTVGDVVDVHSYGGAEALGLNPKTESNPLAFIAAGHVSGMPLSISEWNFAFPVRDRFVAPMWIAATAALQGWDAPMLFAYSQQPMEPPTNPDSWSAFYDAGLMTTMPAAALAFRRGDVGPARETFVLQLSSADVYERATSPATSATLRTLVEQSRIELALPDVPALDWDTRHPARTDGTPLTDADHDALPIDATSVQSDTGELTRDWVAGTHVVDTPRTQAASGWIGGHTIAMKDVELRILTAKAAIAVSSLDGDPIATSQRMLVSAVAQVAATPGERLPLLSELVEGELRVRTPHDLVLQPLRVGVELAPITGRRDGEILAFLLPPDALTHWFLLNARRPA